MEHNNYTLNILALPYTDCPNMLDCIKQNHLEPFITFFKRNYIDNQEEYYIAIQTGNLDYFQMLLQVLPGYIMQHLNYTPDDSAFSETNTELISQYEQVLEQIKALLKPVPQNSLQFHQLYAINENLLNHLYQYRNILFE